MVFDLMFAMIDIVPDSEKQRKLSPPIKMRSHLRTGSHCVSTLSYKINLKKESESNSM